MDDTFFDFIKQASFDVTVSEVLVDPAERSAYCERIGIVTAELDGLLSSSDSVLGYVFADRCIQYIGDLRAGIARDAEGKPNALGPVIFAFKRREFTE